MARSLEHCRSARRTHGLSGVGAALMLTLLMVTLGGLGGCQIRVGGTGKMGEEMDRLRARNMELERQVERLEEDLERRRGQVHTLEQQLERVAEPMEGAEIPVFSSVHISRYTSAYDRSGDGRDDSIRAYVHTRDQQGRMMPVAGRATLRVVWAGGEGEPLLLVKRAFEPAELDEAYRSGFTGAHYTLRAQLRDDLHERLPAGRQQLTVYVAVRDAVSGAEHTRSHIVPITVAVPEGDEQEAESVEDEPG